MTEHDEASPCHQEVYVNGITVFAAKSMPVRVFEPWVKKVAKKSGTKTDWFPVGGTGVVRTLGDPYKVQKVIEKLMPELIEIYYKYIEQLLGRFDEHYPPGRYYNWRRGCTVNSLSDIKKFNWKPIH